MADGRRTDSVTGMTDPSDDATTPRTLLVSRAVRLSMLVAIPWLWPQKRPARLASHAVGP